MGLSKGRLKALFNKKITDPLLQILRRGTEPKQLAFSAALGITLGIFPIVGVPVFLCGVAIAFFGSVCHAPTVMLANIIATPAEIAVADTKFEEPPTARMDCHRIWEKTLVVEGWAVQKLLVGGRAQVGDGDNTHC